MFSEHQLLLLQKERERELAREWRNEGLHRIAKQAKRARQAQAAGGPKRIVHRALVVALLIALLALGITQIAHAQSTITLSVPYTALQGENLDGSVSFKLPKNFRSRSGVDSSDPRPT